MEKLTPKQEVILDILKKLIAKNGYPPTVREIGKEAHLSSPATIHFHLKQLELKGYIKQDLNKNKEIFSLKVSGESMINVGIYDGDIVIVEKTSDAKNGETVVAMNEDNEATVKTFYKEKDHIRLQPENDYMEPIILKDVTILGKVIGLFRRL